MNTDNIILIGMPGVGKSTIGVILAKVLGKQFMDSDLVIQQEYKARLSDLISTYGSDGFLAIENRVNAGLFPTDTIIATGGSAVYGDEAMRHFRDIGTVVYLRIGYDDLVSRLGDLTKRGVVHKEGQTLRDLYDERCALYEKYADLIIDEAPGYMNIEKTVEDIVEAIDRLSA